MANEEILPAKILQFLDEYIDSIEQLRVLLLLEAKPDRIWTTPEITAELRSTESSIFKRLEDLYNRKVLSRGSGSPDQHRFNPVTDEIRVLVRELAEINHLRPYRVIEVIYSRPRSAIKAFADAFKIRGDE